MAEDLALDDPEVEYTPESDAPPPAAGGSFGSGRTVLALWLPTPSRRRLIDADLDIVEDAGDNPSLILASTRGPSARRSSIRTLAASAPVVVVCHPGGEAIAAEMVALGACAVVAEGSEGAAVRVLDGESSTHLVEAYLSEVDRSGAGGSTVSFDPVTGLPGSRGFDLRLTELGKDGGMPRLGLIDLGLDIVLRQIGRSGHAAMKRRLSVAIAGAAGSRAAEMFDLGPMLAILAGSMPSPVAHALGAEVLDIGATFAPNGEPLEVAVGWAGPEAASDTDTLRLLAGRALELARTRESKLADADELGQHAAAAIELNAFYGVADAVDALDSRGDHSVRVSDHAAALARELQLDPGEVAEIALAARLHDIGKAGYGASAFTPASDVFEEARARHPERGEKLVLPNAGAGVAAIVRAHHERWDGSGFPDGRAGTDIPMGARILAVAHRYDDLANAGTPRLQIEAELRSESGQTLDPDLVEAAIALFGRG
jgi:hypothetical protein